TRRPARGAGARIGIGEWPSPRSIRDRPQPLERAVAPQSPLLRPRHVPREPLPREPAARPSDAAASQHTLLLERRAHGGVAGGRRRPASLGLPGLPPPALL